MIRSLKQLIFLAGCIMLALPLFMQAMDIDTGIPDDMTLEFKNSSSTRNLDYAVVQIFSTLHGFYNNNVRTYIISTYSPEIIDLLINDATFYIQNGQFPPVTDFANIDNTTLINLLSAAHYFGAWKLIPFYNSIIRDRQINQPINTAAADIEMEEKAENPKDLNVYVESKLFTIPAHIVRYIPFFYNALEAKMIEDNTISYDPILNDFGHELFGALINLLNTYIESPHNIKKKENIFRNYLDQLTISICCKLATLADYLEIKTLETLFTRYFIHKIETIENLDYTILEKNLNEQVLFNIKSILRDYFKNIYKKYIPKTISKNTITKNNHTNFENVKLLKLSPNGTNLCIYTDKNLKFVNLETKTILDTISLELDIHFESIQISNDEFKIVLTTNNAIYVWNRIKKYFKKINLPFNEEDNRTFNIVFSPDSSKISITTQDDWIIVSGDNFDNFRYNNIIPNGNITSSSWSFDSKYCAITIQDDNETPFISVLDLDAKKFTVSPMFEDSDSGLVLGIDNKTFLTIQQDGQIDQYNIPEYKSSSDLYVSNLTESKIINPEQIILSNTKNLILISGTDKDTNTKKNFIIDFSGNILNVFDYNLSIAFLPDDNGFLVCTKNNAISTVSSYTFENNRTEINLLKQIDFFDLEQLGSIYWTLMHMQYYPNFKFIRFQQRQRSFFNKILSEKEITLLEECIALEQKNMLEESSSSNENSNDSDNSNDDMEDIPAEYTFEIPPANQHQNNHN